MVDVLMAAVLAGLAVVSVAAAAYSSRIMQRVVSASRLARVNADEIALLHDRVDMVTTGIKRIEGRQVKAEQRRKPGAGDDGPPDPKTDPEGWKQWQNRAIVRNRSNLQ